MEIQNSPSHSTKIRNRCAQPYSIDLPQPIIEKILSKLPVKSLLRFRCVSKSWFSLIRSQDFIKTHHKYSIKNPSFPKQRVLLHIMRHTPEQCSLQSLLSDPSIHPSPLDVPIDIRLKLLKVVGCSNGLVCVLEEPQQFFIWNPSTRISKKLPDIGGSGCVENYGFGRVESSGEYKVFAVVSGFNKFYRMVYSSKTKSWKGVGLLDLPFRCEEGVFVDGKLYWDCNHGIVAAFDLKSEVFKQIRSPNDRRERLNKSLGVIGGCLCMLYYHQKGIRVWVLKGDMWEVVASPRHVLELLERPFSTPFIVGQNGEILLFHGSTFLIYNPRDNVFRCPKIFCNYQFQHLYVESLVSPEHC